MKQQAGTTSLVLTADQVRLMADLFQDIKFFEDYLLIVNYEKRVNDARKKATTGGVTSPIKK